MDATVVAERSFELSRASELRTRAAEARQEAAAKQQRSERACDRSAEVLGGFTGRPFGDRDGRFLLRVARCRPMVRFVRHDLGRWLEQAGLPPEIVSEVKLACSEACANSVEHARQASRQLVEVEARLAGTQLDLRIRDFGGWIDRRGSPLRGRGLDLIRTLMDSLDIRRTADGTELVMRKMLVP